MSRPKEHAAAIERKASECGPNFRRIIKMIKHWNSVHGAFLQSYHIEVIAIRVLSGDLSNLTWHLHKFFEDGRKLLDSWLWHEIGFADNYLTPQARAEICKRFDGAIRLSQSAWYLTYGANEEHEKAIGLWRQIFGDRFPAYAS